MTNLISLETVRSALWIEEGPRRGGITHTYNIEEIDDPRNLGSEERFFMLADKRQPKDTRGHTTRVEVTETTVRKLMEFFGIQS